MKKHIYLIIALAFFIFGSAQTDKPEYINGFPIHDVIEIYRVSATLELGKDGCKTVYYWYVDEYGRPIEFNNIQPSETITPEDMLLLYFNTLPPAQNPFYKAPPFYPNREL